MGSLYEQEHFRAAAGAEFRPGGLDLTGELAAGCDLQPGQRVLDLGCGVGSTASYLARRWGVASVGLDASARFIDEAAVRDPAITWVLGRAEEIPFPDGYFDCVFSECFISTLDHPDLVLQEVRRVLRPSGHLAVTDMYLRNSERPLSLTSVSRAACLRGSAGKRATLSLFEREGFTVRVWQDRSDALKSLTASLIFSYGSAAAFWDAAIDAGSGLRESVIAARPGYYLLIAQPFFLECEDCLSPGEVG